METLSYPDDRGANADTYPACRNFVSNDQPSEENDIYNDEWDA